MITALPLGYVHGSCVDFEGKAVLVIGPSGSGKSSFALELIALGGVLISDDQVVLSKSKQNITVKTPPHLGGMIEARGIGLLKCSYIQSSHLNLVVDMSIKPQSRMPKPRTIHVGNVHIDVIAGQAVPNLPIAVRLFNLYGYVTDTKLK